jgi:UDP-2,3-diacylglucosamine pyrophosphatase LpxH
MTVSDIGLRHPTRVPEVGRSSRNLWLNLVFRRLNKVFERSESVWFDDDSRIVFFSDCHRGDNGRSDSFKHNKEITVRALDHYYRQGFTYVEIGDGDDLWQVSNFHSIVQAHGCVFDRLQRFQDEGRLYMILGNHEIGRGQRHLVRKGNLVAEEGLVLRHGESGKTIFVVHGHQADFFSDLLIPISRLTVRHLVKKLHALGLAHHQREISSLMNGAEMGANSFASRLEKPLVAWAEAHRRIIVCGHTHRAAYPLPGKPPYFNSGSCVYPGFITALSVGEEDTVQEISEE